jgi:hypothetical protein
LAQIEFVEHSVIADSQSEFGAALEPLVREIFQLCAYVIHFALDASRTDSGRQSNAFENVGDQTWSAVATIHSG